MLNRSIISTLLSAQPHEQDHEVTKQWPGVGRQGVMTDSRAKEPTQEFSSRPWSLSASSLESIDSYSLLGLGPGCLGSWRNFHSCLEFWPLQPSPCLVSWYSERCFPPAIGSHSACSLNIPKGACCSADYIQECSIHRASSLCAPLICLSIWHSGLNVSYCRISSYNWMLMLQ